MKQTLNFRLECKALAEDGTFEGLLSVYDVKDLGGDVVEAGAFTKSLKESGGRVPLLWQHDEAQPIGWLDLTDSNKALKARGTLILEDVPRAREAYSLLKAGVLKGLSIGYQTIKDSVKDGTRFLKEVQLWEGSLVTFPMLPEAQVTGVKAGRRLSTDTRLRLSNALGEIQSLLTEADEAEAEADTAHDEPTDPSLIEQLQQLDSQFNEALSGTN